MLHYLNRSSQQIQGILRGHVQEQEQNYILIKPLGFSTDDKMLKRAGLDYWEHVDITYHEGIREMFAAYPEAVFYFLTKHGEKPHTSFDYSDSTKDIFFVFGKETTWAS